MPIQSVELRAGDPTIQATGERRGTVDITFTDGRVVTRPLRGKDAADWAQKLLDIDAQVQAQVEQQDANDGVDPDAEVVANGEASIEQRAVAYLRRAWQEEQAHAAYLLFDRFNTFRLSRGWNLSQVQAGLASAGLGVEEWEAMKTAYQYLNGGGRPAIMDSFKTIQGNWEGREQF